MQRYAVFFHRVREIARRLRIAVIEMRGAAENFEVVNSGVADGCEKRGCERLMRVHVSGENAVHPAPWQFDDEPWSVEIGLASIVRPGVPRAECGVSENPHLVKVGCARSKPKPPIGRLAFPGWDEEHARASPGGKQREQATALHMAQVDCDGVAERVHPREIPRLRVPALRAKAKTRDTPLGMTT